jgi:hypothetical protein
MKKRRQFLNDFTRGVSFSFLIPLVSKIDQSSLSSDSKKSDFEISLTSPGKFFDGKSCWVHPRAGIIPEAGDPGLPRIVMTMNTLDLSGSDVFKSMLGLESKDFGNSWTAPTEISNMAPRFEIINEEIRPVAASDFWPKFHQKTQTLLGIGHTVVYTPDWKVKSPRPRHTSYATYDLKENTWNPWGKIAMPNDEKFVNCGAGSGQRYDAPNGDILLPVSFYPKGKNAHITTLLCHFDGKQLTYQRQGNELGIDNETRGLHEPSLTKFKGQFFLTIRNDKNGYVSTSEDGLHFNPQKVWTFDDGTNLGNYNTQQHWVTHSDALYLVYTRRGANNDHVFRHRAPLFIAQVDTEKLCVIRQTEKVLVPERGARLGNFGVLDISPEETWVTVSEWMQPPGVEKYGSDGSLWIARIKWNKKNRLVKT